MNWMAKYDPYRVDKASTKQQYKTFNTEPAEPSTRLESLQEKSKTIKRKYENMKHSKW